MFLGRGDSSQLNVQQRETLDDLRRLIETGHITALTPDQVEVALAAIKFYSSITATTGILAGARNVLLYVGGMLAIWWATQEWVVDTIRQIAAGQ